MGLGMREVSMVATVIELYFCCGMIFGWPNLVQVFERDGFFAAGCGSDTSANTSAIDIEVSNIAKRDAEVESECIQDESLTAVFGYASAVFSVTALFTGIIYDRYGTAITRHIGTGIFVLGIVVMAAATPGKSDRYVWHITQFYHRNDFFKRPVFVQF